MTNASNCQNLLNELQNEIIKLELENATLGERLEQIEQQKVNTYRSEVKPVHWIELEPGKRFLTKKELGRYLSIAVGTISNQISKGIFPIRSKRVGNCIRFDMREIIKYLDTNLPFWERDHKLK